MATKPLDPVNYQIPLAFDDKGQPYYMTAGGQRSYVPPVAAMSLRGRVPGGDQAADWAAKLGYVTNPQGTVTGHGNAPGSSLFRERGHWDPQSGSWKQDINWNNIISLAVGGALTGGAISAFAGAPAAAGTSGSVAGGGAGGGTAGAVAGGAPGISTAAGQAGLASLAGTAPTTASALGAAPAAAGTVGGGAGGAMNWGNIAKWADRAGDIWGAIGKPASGAAQGLADDRNLENDWKSRRDATLALLARDQASFDLQNAQSLYDRNRLQSNDIFDTGMRGAEFDRTGQSREMRQAMLAGMLGNAQDFKITPSNPNVASRMPTISGPSPSTMLGSSKDSIMGLLGRPQIKAPTYTPPTPYGAPAGYQKPPLSSFTESGAAEDWLSLIGFTGQAADAYNRRNQTPTK